MKKLELYIHIPFCVRKCNYCDFLSFAAEEETQRKYLKALKKEIALAGEKRKDYEVSTIFFGGGTPSCINGEWISLLMDTIRKSFFVDPFAEITIECNPGTLTGKKLSIYKECGINRLSIGLQSADNDELRLLGRIHTWEEFLEGWNLARSMGFHNCNIDLISSLPHQTEAAFARTLEKVLALQPEHISAYSLIIEAGTPFAERYTKDLERRERGEETLELPDEDTEYRIGKTTQRILQENGYERYEISNYQRNGNFCRHNIGYWTGAEYLGLGLGASSYIDRRRITNTRNLNIYIESIEHNENPAGEVIAIDTQAEMEEFMFLGLRMTAGVSLEEFQRKFGMTLEEAYPGPVCSLQINKLLRIQDGRAFLTDRGMDLANYCMAQFLK